MKTTPLLAFLLFLLFAFSAKAELVFDSDGDPLRNGGTYKLSPLESIGGGEIISAAIRKGVSDACSLAVVQAQYVRGWPVTIQALVRPTFISTTYQLFLSFAHLPPNVCTNSSGWLVIRSPPVGEPVMVGDAGEFGEAVVSGWFYIKPYDSDEKQYKLVFCHDQKNGECGNIGVHTDSSHNNRLVVTDGKPVVFKFDKVKENGFAYESDLSMVA